MPEETHAVLTGPIQGTVTTAAGVEHDVSPDVVYVSSPEEALEVAHLIGDRYEAEGHPDHLYTGVPFVHDKTGV